MDLLSWLIHMAARQVYSGCAVKIHINSKCSSPIYWYKAEGSGTWCRETIEHQSKGLLVAL